MVQCCPVYPSGPTKLWLENASATPGTLVPAARMLRSAVGARLLQKKPQKNSRRGTGKGTGVRPGSRVAGIQGTGRPRRAAPDCSPACAPGRSRVRRSPGGIADGSRAGPGRGRGGRAARARPTICAGRCEPMRNRRRMSGGKYKASRLEKRESARNFTRPKGGRHATLPRNRGVPPTGRQEMEPRRQEPGAGGLQGRRDPRGPLHHGTT